MHKEWPGQRAALVIRLYYEEERQKAEGRQGTRTDLLTSASKDAKVKPVKTAKILGDKAGVSQPQIERLLAVYRNRPDLFEKVFSGEYTIGKAHKEMKAESRSSRRPFSGGCHFPEIFSGNFADWRYFAVGKSSIYSRAVYAVVKYYSKIGARGTQKRVLLRLFRKKFADDRDITGGFMAYLYEGV
ncbi:hypothetical protein F3157_05415 [Virgibacillus dakarensis]|nr:hypothetical protein [Virgibacillus dakarensis]